MCLALNPGLTRADDLGAVDIELEHIVVRELYPQIFLQVIGGERHRAAHIDIAVRGCPCIMHIWIFVGSAPCSLLLFPAAIVEAALRPGRTRLEGMAHTSCPGVGGIGHRSDGLQQELLAIAHPAVIIPVYAQQALDGFLCVGPVAHATVSQFIKGRPEREIRIVYQ